MSDVYVNGRRVLLQMLDGLLAEEGNIKIFKDAFQNRIQEEPLAFFKDTVLPLMPKEGLALTQEEDNGQSLTVVFKPASPPSPPTQK